MTDQRDADQHGQPAFGPGGYLPDRAAKRARKIVLRSPLGLQWVVGAAIAGVVVVTAGIVFLLQAGGPPGAPFVTLGAADQVGDLVPVTELDLVLVGAGGRIRAFARIDPTNLVYCESSGHLESARGEVWSLTGRGFGGVPSLAQHPTVVTSGQVYVDPTTTTPGPPGSDETAVPACV